MRMTIFGASGQTGEQIVRQALDRDDEVTAVLRDTKRLDLTHAGLTIRAIRDLASADAVADAIDGADAVISAIGPRGRKDGPVASPATRSILAALGANASNRLVVISAAPIGSVPDGESTLNRRVLTPVISRILKPVYDDLRSMESDLASSSAEWTAFRPPKLTNGPLARQYRTRIGSNVPRALSISRADLAHAMLASLDRPETVRSTVGIAY